MNSIPPSQLQTQQQIEDRRQPLLDVGIFFAILETLVVATFAAVRAKGGTLNGLDTIFVFLGYVFAFSLLVTNFCKYCHWARHQHLTG
jgi:hypothetical protein